MQMSKNATMKPCGKNGRGHEQQDVILACIPTPPVPPTTSNFLERICREGETMSRRMF